jgi:hypothetical protein
MCQSTLTMSTAGTTNSKWKSVGVDSVVFKLFTNLILVLLVPILQTLMSLGWTLALGPHLLKLGNTNAKNIDNFLYSCQLISEEWTFHLPSYILTSQTHSCRSRNLWFRSFLLTAFNRLVEEWLAKLKRNFVRVGTTTTQAFLPIVINLSTDNTLRGCVKFPQCKV